MYTNQVTRRSLHYLLLLLAVTMFVSCDSRKDVDASSETNSGENVDRNSDQDDAKVENTTEIDGDKDDESTCKDQVCNGQCVDTSSDPRFCGSCETDCRSLPGVDKNGVSCVSGQCILSGACARGYANCDGKVDSGCESYLAEPSHCGTCEAMCPNDRPLCQSTNSASDDLFKASCQSTCGGDLLDVCRGSCVNLENSTSNCGECGHACPQPMATVPGEEHGQALCQKRSCDVSCDEGFHKCSVESQTETKISSLMCAANDDATFCGTDCIACEIDVEHAFPICSSDRCDFECYFGYKRVGNVCERLWTMEEGVGERVVDVWAPGYSGITFAAATHVLNIHPDPFGFSYRWGWYRDGDQWKDSTYPWRATSDHYRQRLAASETRLWMYDGESILISTDGGKTWDHERPLDRANDLELETMLGIPADVRRVSVVGMLAIDDSLYLRLDYGSPRQVMWARAEYDLTEETVIFHKVSGYEIIGLKHDGYMTHLSDPFNVGEPSFVVYSAPNAFSGGREMPLHDITIMYRKTLRDGWKGLTLPAQADVRERAVADIHHDGGKFIFLVRDYDADGEFLRTSLIRSDNLPDMNVVPVDKFSRLRSRSFFTSKREPERDFCSIYETKDGVLLAGATAKYSEDIFLFRFDDTTGYWSPESPADDIDAAFFEKWMCPRFFVEHGGTLEVMSTSGNMYRYQD